MPNWRDIPIYVIDFEGAAKTGVVEYGLVELLGGEIQSTFTRLCQPIASLTSQDTRLHGITQADAADCAPFAEEWDRFRACRGGGVFAAHHASVEHGLLKQQWSYPPASMDYLCNAKRADWGPWLDTRRLYEVVYPGLETYQLGALVEQFALRHELNAVAETCCPDKRRKAHCALYDALASALLILRLTAEEGFEETSIEWLLECSLPTAEKRAAFRQGEIFD